MAMLMNDRNLRSGLAENTIRSRIFRNPRESWSPAEFRRRLRMGCVVAAMGGSLIASGCTTYGLYIEKQDADEYLVQDKDKKLVKPLKLKPLKQLAFADRTNAKKAMEYVVRLRRAYEVRAIGLTNQKTFFQDLPLLGSGVTTGIAAVFGASASTILGLGGGTAGIAGLTQYAGSKEKTKIYLKGASALLCVEQKGEPLVDLSPKRPPKSSDASSDSPTDDVRDLESDISKANDILNAVPKEAIGRERVKKTLDFIRDSLSKAIKDARDAVKKGKKAAGLTSGHPIYLAAAAVELKVLSLLTSIPVDVKKLAAGAAMGAKPATPKAPSEKVTILTARKSDADKVEEASKTIKSLNTKSAGLVKKAAPLLAVNKDLQACVDGLKK